MIENDGGKANLILVVDDDTQIRSVLSRSLTRLGYDVLQASDGGDGFEQAVREKPDLVITDIRMPNVDGHTLLRRLEAHNPDLPVIVMSGDGDMNDVMDVLRHGAIDYLKKPWTPSELMGAVVRAIDIGEKRKLLSNSSRPPDVTAHARISSATDDGSKAPTSQAVLAEIKAKLARGEIPLPAVPAVVAELRVLVANPDVKLDTVTALIERDAHIAAQVLQIANSALSSRANRNSDIRSAIAHVGMRQIHSIVETIFMRQCYPIREPRLAQLERRIRRFSIARAISMRAIADLASHLHLETDIAYTAGLLADTGASFLIWVHSELVVAGAKKLGENLDDYAAALAAEHCNVGRDVLARWSLDPIIVSLAGSHHDDSPPAPANLYWTLSTVGAELANQLAPEDDVTRAQPIRLGLVDRCLGELQISPLVMSKLLEQLRTEFKGITAAIG